VPNYILATGRRKKSIARIRLAKGNGNIEINGKKPIDYLHRETLDMMIRQPLDVTESVSSVDIIVNVKGGGITGQAGAIRHGIARALTLYDESNRPSLKKNGYLTRDSRMVERKKYGQRGARKKFQFSKR
jgi:small subunit ribosomal protein S9